MVDKERVAALAKMFLELRMAGSQAEAEARALHVIQSTDGSGPTLAAAHEEPGQDKTFEMQPQDQPIAELPHQEMTGENPHPDDATPTREEERPLDNNPVDVHEVRPKQTARMISAIDSARAELLAAIGKAPEPDSTTSFRSTTRPAEVAADAQQDDLDTAQDELRQVSEEETKESLNATELAEELEKMRHELVNARKEVEMLRHKLTKTEYALQKAETLTTMSERQIATPQPRNEPPPNHERPRGQNPSVDLSKIFGRK